MFICDDCHRAIYGLSVQIPHVILIKGICDMCDGVFRCADCHCIEGMTAQEFKAELSRLRQEAEEGVY